MVLDIFLVWIERKVVARFQDRLGPNRIGPFGIFQPFADVIKLSIKEDITPATADKFVFNLAPILSLASVIILWAVLPLASTVYGVDLNVALLYLVAAGALGTLSIIMAGWALLIPTILSGTLSLKEISAAQNDVWFFFVSPLGAILFLVAAIAELGRSPFDLNEGESEIVAGFHIEYTGMKFGLFYAGELLHAFTFGAFLGVLFFGGWNGPLPFGDQYALIGMFNVIFKGMFFYWVIMWVKYTVPRIRIDHMLAFNWKFLTPVAFALLMVTAVLHRLLQGADTLVYVIFMFVMNLVFGWTVVEILRSSARKQREAVEGKTQQPAAAQH